MRSTARVPSISRRKPFTLDSSPVPRTLDAFHVVFTETEGSRKSIGDVDVLYHEGLYHLFHLVLPNHDFIAHAVSTDAINWRRVNNALVYRRPGFVGRPDAVDDGRVA